MATEEFRDTPAVLHLPDGSTETTTLSRKPEVGQVIDAGRMFEILEVGLENGVYQLKVSFGSIPPV